MILTPYNKPATDVTPLYDRLPMDIPFSLMIEPTNMCNFRCIFCPTGNHLLLDKIKRPKGFMDFDLYVKIIKDIERMCVCCSGKLHRLHLYKDGEPLLHKDIGAMILNAKKTEQIDSVELTTNASLLTSENAAKLIDNGLDALRVSIEHVNSDKYKEITKTFSGYEEIKRNVEFIFSEKIKRNKKLHVHVKIIDTGLSEEEKNKFISDFSCICDSINIDPIGGWSMSFRPSSLETEGHIASNATGIHSVKTICPEPFSKLAINFNGTVSVCSADWSHGTVVGDLRKESLADIWHGENLKRIRLLHLSGKRHEIPPCRDCDHIKRHPEFTNLDKFSDILLTKYK